MRFPLLPATLAVGLLLPLAALAQDAVVDLAAAATPIAAPAPAADAHAHAFPLRAWVQERFAGSGVSAIDVGRPLPTDPQLLGPTTQTENRLRLGLGLDWSSHSGFLRKAMLEGEADVFSDIWSEGTHTSDQRLRKGFIELTTLAGQVSAGRMVSTWGLGILAQSGEEDAMQFGLRRGGSLVDRVQYAILPAALIQSGDPLKAFPLAVVVAYDRIVRDDLMDVENGDHGRQAIGALLYRSADLDLGAYGVSRTQRDKSDLGADVLMGDVYGAWRQKIGSYKLEIAGEWAVIDGSTTWFRTVAHPSSVDILQHGGVLRADLSRGRVSGRLEFGLASGDSRPQDGTLRNMKFASDYRVGLILFPEFVKRQAQIAAANVGDPRFAAAGPAGLERSDTGGAVSQALYIHPVVRFDPAQSVSLLWGAVWARSPVDVADIYKTAMAGGTPTGPRGAKDKRDLGLEFDTAIELHHRATCGITMLARVDGGVLLPGDAFSNPNAVDPAARDARIVGVVLGQVGLRANW